MIGWKTAFLSDVVTAITKLREFIVSVRFSWTGARNEIKKLNPLQEVMTIERTTFTDKSTIGEVHFDGVFFCYSLEDTCRAKGVKIQGQTAIPAGRYEILITHSTRFNRETPQLMNVPNFEGIRIHPGNTAVDTQGCILPGYKKDVDAVYDSQKAYNALLEEIRQRLSKDRLFVSVIGGIHTT